MLAPDRADVALLRWPADAHRRDGMAARRAPRLWLVPEGVAAPEVDDDEDWIRVPAGERDVWARMEALARAAARRRPRMAHDVVVLFGGRTAVVAEDDAPLVRLLVDRFEERVTWAEVRGSVVRGVARARLARLRGRLRGVGLDLRTSRTGVHLTRAEAT